ncbi:MAG: hypothetical protein ACJ75J_08845 [Cytophagaceae bacterium]
MKTLLSFALLTVIFASCVHRTCDTYSGAKKIKHSKARVLAFQNWK